MASRTRKNFTGLAQRSRLELAHIKAHNGDPWNELADVAAKYVDKNKYTHAQTPTVSIPEAKWYKAPDILAYMYPTHDTYDPTPIRLPLPLVPTRHERAEVIHTFRVATMNVLTMRYSTGPEDIGDIGRPALLRRQARQHDLRVIGVQESRYRHETSFRSDGFMVFASATDGGQYGCELWIDFEYSISEDGADFFLPETAMVVLLPAASLL